MIPIGYNIRSLFVRKTSTIATLLGITLVVFVLSAAMMLSSGLRKTLGASGSKDRAIVLRQGSEAELSSDIDGTKLSLVLAQPGIKKALAGQPAAIGEQVIVVTMDKIGTEGVSNVQIRGVPENVVLFRPEIKITAGRFPKPGTDEVMAGSKISGRFKGLELGQSFELRKNRRAQVVGIFTADGSSFESEIWADIETVRTSFGRQGSLSSIRVQLSSAQSFDVFEAAIKQDKNIGLNTIREDVYFEKISENTTVFINTIGILIASIFSIAAMIGAMITMYASIANRGREIGTLRALGFSRATILFSFVLETLILGIAGGLLGILLTLPLAFVKISMVNFSSWSEVVFKFSPTLRILLTAFLFAAIVGLIGGLGPAIRAARTPALRAMRE